MIAGSRNRSRSSDTMTLRCIWVHEWLPPTATLRSSTPSGASRRVSSRSDTSGLWRAAATAPWPTTGAATRRWWGRRARRRRRGAMCSLKADEDGDEATAGAKRLDGLAEHRTERAPVVGGRHGMAGASDVVSRSPTATDLRRGIHAAVDPPASATGQRLPAPGCRPRTIPGREAARAGDHPGDPPSYAHRPGATVRSQPRTRRLPHRAPRRPRPRTPRHGPRCGARCRRCGPDGHGRLVLVFRRHRRGRRARLRHSRVPRTSRTHLLRAEPSSRRRCPQLNQTIQLMPADEHRVLVHLVAAHDPPRPVLLPEHQARALAVGRPQHDGIAFVGVAKLDLARALVPAHEGRVLAGRVAQHRIATALLAAHDQARVVALGRAESDRGLARAVAERQLAGCYAPPCSRPRSVAIRRRPPGSGRARRPSRGLR